MTELKQQIRENGIWYTLVGDYYIPNLTLPEEERSIGRYGRLHREYIKETKPHRELNRMMARNQEIDDTFLSL